MGSEIVVFLGPTLDPQRAVEHLDALYLPPVEQGAVFQATMQLKPRALVLIDGVFAKAPAVRHKEILWTLSQGIPVFGAASMGALRAAELAAFGMQGHGLIYRWYRATTFVDDDEVAVAMAPAELGARPLSEALINMRITLRRAERTGKISTRMRHALEDLARSMHFIERSYSALFETARHALPRKFRDRLGPLEEWVAGHAIDQKQDDAVALLRRLAGAPPQLLGGGTRQHSFRLTDAWLADLDAAGFDTTLLSKHEPRRR
jgi:hypothetical protein